MHDDKFFYLYGKVLNGICASGTTAPRAADIAYDLTKVAMARLELGDNAPVPEPRVVQQANAKTEVKVISTGRAPVAEV